MDNLNYLIEVYDRLINERKLIQLKLKENYYELQQLQNTLRKLIEKESRK